MNERNEVPDLVAVLDTALRSRPDTWDEGALHASDLAVAIEDDGDRKCGRQLWLRTHGAEKREPSTGELLMWHHGRRIEREVVAMFAEHLPDGWSIGAVNRQVGDSEITAELDIELHGPNGVVVVVDVKTVRGNWFRYAKVARPSAEMQVRKYMARTGADYGILLYIDREGQNPPEQFYVDRDDAAIVRAEQVAREIVSLPMAPAVMPPKVKVRENKGPDAVYAELPWQCNYCPYLGISCEGALAPADRNDGVIGHTTRYGFKACVPLSDAAEAAICFQIEAEPVEEVA